MDGRSLKLLSLGFATGIAVSAAVAIGAVQAVRATGATADRGARPLILAVRPVQDQTRPGTLPKDFVPILVPNNGNSIGPGQPSPGLGGNNPGAQQPSPGGGGQDCNGKVLFFYQGRLYQLSPGPMPPNGGNPEFFYMQPYQGPQIPGFPGQNGPGGPTPGLPSLPPTFKF